MWYILEYIISILFMQGPSCPAALGIRTQLDNDRELEGEGNSLSRL